MQNRTVMLWLGYAGLLPFYGFLLGACFSITGQAPSPFRGLSSIRWAFSVFWVARFGAGSNPLRSR